MVNARLIFDDLQLPYGFQQLVSKHGWFKSVIILFCLDLPAEYRTYGISRVTQFLLWSVFGSSKYVYGAFIAVTQIATAVALQRIFMRLKIEELPAAVISSLWLVSPFAITACFHHYSYLILPTQLAVACVWYFTSRPIERVSILSCLIFGAALGLTGEMHLVAVFIGFMVIAWLVKNKAIAKCFFISAVSALVSVVAHYSIWRWFAADMTLRQRLDGNKVATFQEVLHRAEIAIISIWNGFLDQLITFSPAGFFVTGITGLAIGWCLWSLAVFNSKDVSSSDDAPILRPIHAALIVFFAAMYLFVYVVTSVYADSVYSVLPRRYGYSPYSIILIGIGVFIYSVSGRDRKSMLPLFSLLGVVFVFFAQQQMYVINPSVRVDEKITEEIQSKATNAPIGELGVLFFNAADQKIPRFDFFEGMAGPRMQSNASADAREAVYAPYSVSKQFLTNILGFGFSGAPGAPRPDGLISVVGRPTPADPGPVLQEKVMVVANLGFENHDPDGKNVKIFKNYSDFKPYFFSKRIDKQIFKVDGMALGGLFVDMGQAEDNPQISDSFPDKKFDEPMVRGNSFVNNYGILSGYNGLYSNENISPESGFLRTNRHGSFTYGFDLKAPTAVEVSFYFWEQWPHEKGGRVFDLDISWDGMTWANVARVDPFLINGQQPFAIVLQHPMAGKVLFRIVKAEHSKDIPLVQGVRVRSMAVGG